jgi:galactokinase
MQLALDAAWAEQTYYGKPCGAQDQLASAFGGILALDFADKTPRVSPIKINLDELPFSICLVDSHCDHSVYNDEFSSITSEMRSIAEYFGYQRLRDAPLEALLEQVANLRQQFGDRPVLRALHYYDETRRVGLQQLALENGDFQSFLQLVSSSGASSAQFLQNITPAGGLTPPCGFVPTGGFAPAGGLVPAGGLATAGGLAPGGGATQAGGAIPAGVATPAGQPLMLILALCTHLLDDISSRENRAFLPTDGCLQAAGEFQGACRVHGGGFGGSVIAFVPKAHAASFATAINTLLGYDACLLVKIGEGGVLAEVLD